MNNKILIAVLSWEDRYILGLKKCLDSYPIEKVILFKYNNPLTAEWKNDNLAETRRLISDILIEVEIDGSKPEINWFIFKETLEKNCAERDIILDITTMTREVIWSVLFNAKKLNAKSEFVYNKPEKYSNDWISRDPGKPRLLYKMSGIAKLGAPTLLLVTGGYDLQRMDSLIHNFEPKATMLFFQDNDEPRNNKVFEDTKALFGAKYGLNLIFRFDPYDIDKSFMIMLSAIKACDETGKIYLNEYNIILNSLGAKISAISLFKIWLEFPHVALSYIPSKEYNKDYSNGIGGGVTGII